MLSLLELIIIIIIIIIIITITTTTIIIIIIISSHLVYTFFNKPTHTQNYKRRDTSSRYINEIPTHQPKLNNAEVQNRRTQNTNSNIFIEEPDVFIMPPGQRRKKSLPESPPLKPPAVLPFEEVELKPPTVPPRTYIKLKFDNEPSADEEVGTPLDVIVHVVEPKQSNIERAKGVRFHHDVKFTLDPPPIPQRGQGTGATVATENPAIVIANTTAPKEDLTKTIVTTTITGEDLAITGENIKDSDSVDDGYRSEGSRESKELVIVNSKGVNTKDLSVDESEV